MSLLARNRFKSIVICGFMSQRSYSKATSTHCATTDAIVLPLERIEISNTSPSSQKYLVDLTMEFPFLTFK